jgi:hypothetical protein
VCLRQSQLLPLVGSSGQLTHVQPGI